MNLPPLCGFGVLHSGLGMAVYIRVPPLSVGGLDLLTNIITNIKVSARAQESAAGRAGSPRSELPGWPSA